MVVCVYNFNFELLRVKGNEVYKLMLDFNRLKFKRWRVDLFDYIEEKVGIVV